MTSRRDFLIKSGQIVALGAMSEIFVGCTPNSGTPTIEHKLPKLSYEYKDLEPFIDSETMTIHHSKHHQGYVDKLNKALQGQKSLQQKSVEDLLKNIDDVPNSIRESVRNNGGGHYNHSIFWSTMKPKSGGNPSGELQKALDKSFGSVNNFKSMFSKQTASVFGSGWGWLTVSSGKLEIVTTSNQDNPISNNKIPILGLDVWEHAYYLKYQNLRNDYVKAWWNVVDWDAVSKRFEKTT